MNDDILISKPQANLIKEYSGELAPVPDIEVFQDDAFSYDGYQVVRGEFFAHILTLHDFKVDRGSCASLRMGTIILFNAIREELQQENIILSDTLITDAMQGRLQHVDQDRIQIIVERRMRHYLKELFNAFRERGLDLKLPVTFAGGGAELFGKRLYSGDVNTIAILDRFANAEGYKLLLG